MMAYRHSYLDEDLLGNRQERRVSPATRQRNVPVNRQENLPTTRERDLPDISRLSMSSNRLVIGIDYGTTFTGVAYSFPKTNEAILDEVQIVSDWGRDMTNDNKIPSVISNSPTNTGHQQWGASLSPTAVTMVNTKMELEVQDNKIDELELLIQVLDGTHDLSIDYIKRSRGNPEYSWKSPEDIMTDYMTHIFGYVSRVFDNLGDHLRANIQVDIVITVPVRWSYRAQNSTFRAIRNAGFNENDMFPSLATPGSIMLVSEPEAAAIYTARHLKEDKSIQFLKVGECFILCDAGGGTVDVVSYKVTRLEPNLELKQLGIPSSAKCGSAWIDTGFKQWLQGLLGSWYRELDPENAGKQIGAHTTEGERLREVMKKFDKLKKAFSSQSSVMEIDLPSPLDQLNIPGKVVQGQLTISDADMRDFFDPSVDEVIELIEGQRLQVEKARNRVKNVFLVGGYGESRYLQEELIKSLAGRKTEMRRPDEMKAWTAVVRGAVIYGIEKHRHQNMTFMYPFRKSYGVLLDEVYSVHRNDSRDTYVDPVTNRLMAHKQLTWLIRRGDLLLSTTKREEQKDFKIEFQERDERIREVPIYVYPDDDDDLPERFETAENEITKIAVLRCDLSNYRLSDFHRFSNPTNNLPYYVAYLVCKMNLSATKLDVEILWDEKVLCKETIDVESVGPQRQQ